MLMMLKFLTSSRVVSTYIETLKKSRRVQETFKHTKKNWRIKNHIYVSLFLYERCTTSLMSEKKSRTWRVHDSHLNIRETRFLKLLYDRRAEVGVIYFLLLTHTHHNNWKRSIPKKICVFFSCVCLIFSKESSLTPRCFCFVCYFVRSKWWLQKRSKAKQIYKKRISW